jgi:hypothetical protein
VTAEERDAERRQVVTFLAQPGGEVLIRHLRRRFQDGGPSETSERMLNRLGRLDALADIERLRDEAKGT